MKNKEFDNRFSELNTAINKMIFDFEKSNNCLIEKYSVYRSRKDGIINSSTRSQIDINE